MRRTTLLLLFALACGTLLHPVAAHAHFLWLVRDARTGGKIQVYFGEAAQPDDPALLGKVAAAEVWSIEGRGQPKPLKLVQSAESLSAEQARPATSILRHNYGVVEKGGAPFLLKYYAKSYPFALPGTWTAVRDAERLPLEVTPSLDEAGVRLTVTWAGKPLAGAVVTVNGPGLDSKLEGPTDAEGRFVCKLAQPGLHSILAKHAEETAGTHDGQEYKSIRHYSTLSLHYVPAQLSPAVHDFPPLAKGTTSFGGAVVGDALFVYGGNYGSAHEYANEDQSGDLWRLDLNKPGQWEIVGTGPRLQGLAMVEHRGKLIRVGGFTARNKSGEPQNLVSQADVARFDPQSRTWESLPTLPQPRSSHDAAVIGDTLYVVGGWALRGESKNSHWHETALALDLSAEKLEWREIAAPPFKRRALALAEWGGKLACVGGMMESGGPTTAVAIYDPAANRWSEGPALQGGAMDGFGASAFASRDSLYVTTVSGSIQRLSGEGQAWEYVGQLAQPRFFHRLLPWQGTQLLVVGGASMEEGKTEALEKLNIATAKTAERLRVGNQAVDRVLFLGNSITLHGPLASIGWMGNWGMAASAPEKDYVHLLTERIAKAAGGRPRIKVRNIADFERTLSEYPIAKNLKEELEFQPDLVILAIGENAAAPRTEAERTRFLAAVSSLLAELQRRGRPTILVRSQFWPDDVKDPLLKQAVEQAAAQSRERAGEAPPVRYVDIRPIGQDPSHAARAERQIEHAGVAGHPGDKGMAAIAAALWKSIQ